MPNLKKKMKEKEVAEEGRSGLLKRAQAAEDG